MKNQTLAAANQLLGTHYTSMNNVSTHRNLTETFIEKFQDIVNCEFISSHQTLSENFIQKFQHKVNWTSISFHQQLSQAFIETFQDKLCWAIIGSRQTLSEDFIEKFQAKLNWAKVSSCQRLSEPFIEKFQNNVCWTAICGCKKLSEAFIEKFQHKMKWGTIGCFQQLSEAFIEKFQTKLYGKDISEFQILSEDIIEKFGFGYFCRHKVSSFQNLSPFFIQKHNLTVPEDCWLHKSVEFKRQQILQTGKYSLEGDYIIAYKGIRSDNYSVYSFLYQYFVGKTYTSHCDCNVTSENSFGLSAWTEERARLFCNQKLIKIKIHLNDLGCMVQNKSKLRCFKFTVIEEINQ